MVFNSFDFLAFIIPVLLLYWLVFKKSDVSQNILLLVSSLVFYAWADWRFLVLLIASTLINYALGIKIAQTEEDKKRSAFLYLGLIFNVGLLLYFKYANFFYQGFYDILQVFGSNVSHNTLQIILPLGISFFTFQTLGYLIDVFNEEIEPSKDLLRFSVFVTFFPKILSGPIERAAGLFPQLEEKRTFSYPLMVDGLRQILWGFFAKVVIAENCAAIVNPIFNDYQAQSGSTLLLGTFFYAIQLYADFSGYSNMAIGVGKLFGIQLMRNFSTPFFSTNIADFWRKWHISLTTWMMDYVFTPLSFILRRHQKRGLMLSIVATFILVGFWHGANWTFVVYGLCHGLYFIPLVYSGKMNASEVVAEGKVLPSFKELGKMILLFLLIMLTDVFFRANNVVEAFDYFGKIFSGSLFDFPSILMGSNSLITLGLILLFVGVEWMHREKGHDFELSKYPVWIRWSAYISIFVLLLFFGKSAETFIYFQF